MVGIDRVEALDQGADAAVVVEPLLIDRDDGLAGDDLVTDHAQIGRAGDRRTGADDVDRHPPLLGAGLLDILGPDLEGDALLARVQDAVVDLLILRIDEHRPAAQQSELGIGAIGRPSPATAQRLGLGRLLAVHQHAVTEVVVHAEAAEDAHIGVGLLEMRLELLPVAHLGGISRVLWNAS